ncbi:flavodoxin family protein [Lysinibacillus sp. SGAir0095]|uniref:flavodoxin family protein n=1 Tax=Lysinibacillus sp. SGAir0095 TaxID=2070463 RepID=UPI0010CCBF87|nr:flavodoxin family protein [Lysinibacillus sp. SGAir0095]QCR32557.1 NAD(P)H-dependent oxidoreductase [Lysinibacillus sp. SGAir0095]
MSIAVIYGSTRENGNTEWLTEQVINGLTVERIYLREYNILPIKDERHSEAGFQEVLDDYNVVIDKVLQHDILIFSTPVYWYSMSGTMKLFIDRWSQTLRDKDRPNFREELAKKSAYVIAVGGDRPSIKALPMIQQFQYICDFFGMTLESYLIGKASKPGEIQIDTKSIAAASGMNSALKKQLASN